MYVCLSRQLNKWWRANYVTILIIPLPNRIIQPDSIIMPTQRRREQLKCLPLGFYKLCCRSTSAASPEHFKRKYLVLVVSAVCLYPLFATDSVVLGLTSGEIDDIHVGPYKICNDIYYIEVVWI